jgi:integrase
MFAELVPHIEALKAARASDTVFTKCRASMAMSYHRYLSRAIEAAKVEQWEKLFTNLRASCRTDLLKDWPEHIVSHWMGHSSEVGDKHYSMITDSDWEKATRK